MAVWLLGAWLYVRCGLSQAQTSRAMTLIFALLLQAIKLAPNLPITFLTQPFKSSVTFELPSQHYQ
jgi:hypothetical protein